MVLGILLIVIAAWLGLGLLVAALCATAARGDRALRASAREQRPARRRFRVATPA